MVIFLFQSLCTAVVQLYTTEQPAHSIWIKRNTGVLCFVRDSLKRSYFMRLYCLLKNELVWEEEMYESIFVNKSKEYLLDFEGRVCVLSAHISNDLFALILKRSFQLKLIYKLFFFFFSFHNG